MGLFDKKKPPEPQKSKSELEQDIRFYEAAAEKVQESIGKHYERIKLDPEMSAYFEKDENVAKFQLCKDKMKNQIIKIDNLKDSAVTKNLDDDNEERQTPEYYAAVKDYQILKQEWKGEIGDEDILNKAIRLAELEKSLDSYESEISSLKVSMHSPTKFR